MAQFKVNYLGDLRTEAEHLKSGQKFITDAPVDNNGKGQAFSPSDTVCAALASCMMTIMGILANRENIDLSEMTADVTKVMVASPRKISEIHIAIKLPRADILSDKHKEMLKIAAYTCPVALSLNPDIKQEVSFNF